MVKRSSFLSNDLGDLGSDLLLWLKSVLKISDYWLRRVRGRCQNEGRQGRSTWWGVPKLIPENPFIAWLACCIRLLLGRLLPHRKCLLSCGWIVFGFEFFCHIRLFLSWYFQAHTRLEFWTNIPKGILEILVAQHPKWARLGSASNLSLNQWLKQVDSRGLSFQADLVVGPELNRQRPKHLAHETVRPFRCPDPVQVSSQVQPLVHGFFQQVGTESRCSILIVTFASLSNVVEKSRWT